MLHFRFKGALNLFRRGNFSVRSSREILPGAKAARENEILQVDIHPALITTIAAVQELAIENQRLREGLAELQARLDALAARLDAR